MANDINATLEQIKRSMRGSGNNIKKATTVTTAANLAPFSLQAPAKNLYPVFTPIRNKLPRRKELGKATNWKEISAIIGSGFSSMPWVPEGQRSDSLTITYADRAASFRSIGEESSLTFEAEFAAEGFEDERAMNTLRALQSLMLKEEWGIVCGNSNYPLGTTPTPTSSVATSAGATINATESIICVALTAEGYYSLRGVPIATGITQTKTITGKDGKTYVLNGGSAIQSAAKSQAVTTGNSLTAAVAPVKGAYAYAWYVGVAGSEKLQSITTNAQVTFTSLTTTGQAATALTGTDYSANASYAWDGLLTVGANNATSYYNQVANGLTLTASGHGSVNEIDLMLYTMWNNYQVSPSVLYVNAQEQKNITTCCLNGTSAAPLTRFVMDNNGGNSLEANQVIASYYNPYQAGGPVSIPVEIHPNLPPGNVLGWADNLPLQYQNANVPNVAEVVYNRDYYQIDWPITTREYQFGVYAYETLAIYAPLAIGVISNVTNGAA